MLAHDHLVFCRPSRDFFILLTFNPAMNGWAIVEALPSAVRRGIFVEPKTKIIFNPVGAASSLRPPDDFAPDGALSVGGWRCYKYASPDGLWEIRVSSVAKKFKRPLAVRPPQTAIGRPAGTLLGSAPVPVAVSAVA